MSGQDGRSKRTKSTKQSTMSRVITNMFVPNVFFKWHLWQQRELNIILTKSCFKVVAEGQLTWDNNTESLLTVYKQSSSSSSSSSSCRAINMDIPDPLSPPVPIVHYFRHVLGDTSYIGTVLLYAGSSWSSYRCSSMWRGPQEYIIYELVTTSPAVSRMSGSSNFDSFHDGW